LCLHLKRYPFYNRLSVANSIEKIISDKKKIKKEKAFCC